jgi:hypothetical protein
MAKQPNRNGAKRAKRILIPEKQGSHYKEEDQKRLQGKGSFLVLYPESQKGAHTSLTQTHQVFP